MTATVGIGCWANDMTGTRLIDNETAEAKTALFLKFLGMGSLTRTFERIRVDGSA
ncbi:MAG: hypothetical protein ACRECW_04355 [Phyllobacterium sp.]